MSKRELTLGWTKILPGCLFLGPAVARARIPFPSHQANSNPILSFRVYFLEKPLNRICAVGVKRKVSHLSSPSGDAETSSVRREAAQDVLGPLTVRAFLEKYPARELVQSR